MTVEGVGGRPCETCNHPLRYEIEAEVLAGGSRIKVAEAHGLGLDAVTRHMKRHVTKAIVAAAMHRKKVAEIEFGGNVLDRVKQLNEVTLSLLRSANENNNPGAVLACVDRAMKGAELEAQLLESMTAMAGEEREFVFAWESPKVCDFCGHDPAECERHRAEQRENA